MTRVSLFNSPLLLGFDHFERVLDRVAKSPSEGYPPYNIEQIGDTGLRITVAVAGFSLEDLTVALEDNQLIIRGKHREDDDQRVFLHRGIGTRQFQRCFVLAEGIEVDNATFDNGLLHVNLVRPQNQPKMRTIAINSAEPEEVHRKKSPAGEQATMVDVTPQYVKLMAAPQEASQGVSQEVKQSTTQGVTGRLTAETQDAN